MSIKSIPNPHGFNSKGQTWEEAAKERAKEREAKRAKLEADWLVKLEKLQVVG